MLSHIKQNDNININSDATIHFCCHQIIHKIVLYSTSYSTVYIYIYTASRIER